VLGFVLQVVLMQRQSRSSSSKKNLVYCSMSPAGSELEMAAEEALLPMADSGARDRDCEWAKGC
jgi:hypothetical protein